MALYNIKAKTRNCSVRLKLHVLDFAGIKCNYYCANGKHLDLLKFGNHIAVALIQATATPVPSPVWRPRDDREKDDLPAAK